MVQLPLSGNWWVGVRNDVLLLWGVGGRCLLADRRGRVKDSDESCNETRMLKSLERKPQKVGGREKNPHKNVP